MNQHLSGLPAWLVQRLSAVYMAIYLLLMPFWFNGLPDDYAHWRAQFASPLVGTATTLFSLALLLHCWVGIRDVILDYFGHRAGLRLMLLALLGGCLLAVGVRAGVVLFGVQVA